MSTLENSSDNIIITFLSKEKNQLLNAIVDNADYAVTHRLINNSSILSHSNENNTIRIKVNLKEKVDFEIIHNILIPELDFMFVLNNETLNIEIYDVETE
jgi:hypothetical protein